MSLNSSEQNYKIAKSLYQDIQDDFFEIENNSEEDDEYLIDQTLEDIKKLNRSVNKINFDDLEEEYSTKVIDILNNNVDTFREAGYFIERALMSMKLFDKIHPVLKEYMSRVRWKTIANTQDEAVMKFGRFLTNENNYTYYKTIISNIVKGTMSKNLFGKLFNQVSSRLTKPKSGKATKQRHPLPPEMWGEKEKKEWEADKKKRMTGGTETEPAPFQNLKTNEEFISLKKYIKQNEL
jgi:hypothetical protein